MSPDDSDSDGGEHSDGGSAGSGSPESQPRDPETGQFLPKDERGETETTGSGETGSTGSESESAEARSESNDRATATGRRGRHPRESPEQHRQSPSMRLYTLPPTHPLARSPAGSTAFGSEGERERPPALDLVTLQVRWDGGPVLRHAADAESQSGPAQTIPNPRTRPLMEAVQQVPPAVAEPQRSPTTGSRRAPAASRQFPGATPRHPSTDGTGPTSTASARPNPTRSTGTGSEAGADGGR